MGSNLCFKPYLRVRRRSWKIDSFRGVQVIMFSQRAPCGKLNSEVWHFGVRKQRSAEQALLVLQERIDTALRARNMVSLMSLHVKGTYCEVSSNLYADSVLSGLEVQLDTCMMTSSRDGRAFLRSAAQV